MKIIYDVYWELDGGLEDYNPFYVHDYQVVNLYYGELDVGYDSTQEVQHEILREIDDIKIHTPYHSVFEIDFTFTKDYWGEVDMDYDVKVLYHGEAHPSEMHYFTEEVVSNIERFSDNLIQLG